MIERLEKIVNLYEEIQSKLSKEKIIKDKKKKK